MKIDEIIKEDGSVPWDDMYDKTAGGTRSMENPMPHVDADDPIFGEVHDWADEYPDSDYTLQDVPVSHIVGTESYVNPDNVKQPKNSEPAVFMHYKGKYFVRDGNHRVISAFLRGEKSIQGYVLPSKV